MGIGPVPAIRKLLAQTGLALGDFDLVELNEAFAPQVLAVLRDVPIDPDRAERQRRRDRARASDRLRPARASLSRCSTKWRGAARAAVSRRSA